MADNEEYIGWTAWAAGPFWGSNSPCKCLPESTYVLSRSKRPGNITLCATHQLFLVSQLLIDPSSILDKYVFDILTCGTGCTDSKQWGSLEPGSKASDGTPGLYETVWLKTIQKFVPKKLVWKGVASVKGGHLSTRN
jgi:hypothetical protein